jgi:hypothetical protein
MAPSRIWHAVAATATVLLAAVPFTGEAQVQPAWQRVIEAWVGAYPADVFDEAALRKRGIEGPLASQLAGRELLETDAVKSAILELTGPERFAEIAEDVVQQPVSADASGYLLYGCMPHACGARNYAALFEPQTGVIRICLIGGDPASPSGQLWMFETGRKPDHEVIDTTGVGPDCEELIWNVDE